MDSQKKLFILRGLPGSGKSTLAKKLAGNDGVVYSTDDFFMVNGKYEYDPKMIPQYHKRNLQKTILAMQKGIQIIVVDNTNIRLCEMRRYVEQGQKYQYKIEIKQADSPWAWDYKQCAKKNAHSVPEQKIKFMLDDYEQFKSIEEIKAAQDNFRRSKKPRN